MGDSRKARGFILCLFALALALSLFSAAFTPPWQIPDEPQHVQLACLLADLGHWPVLSDVRSATALHNGVYASLVRHRFWEIRGHRTPPPSLLEGTSPDLLLPPIYAPPAYYAAAVGRLSLFDGADIDSRLFALRMLSVVLGMVELFLAYRVTRTAFTEEDALALAATAFVALLPMRTFLSGGASSDSLAVVASAAAILAMTAWVSRPLTLKRGAVLGLALALALLTKRTTAFLLPLALVFLALNRRHCPRKGQWWQSVGLGVLCSAAPLVAWAVARPSLTAPGQPWPFPGYGTEGLLGVRLEWVTRLLSADAWTLAALRDHALALGTSFASFWGDFGWLTVPLDAWWYGVLAVLTGLACLGWALRLRRRRGALRPAQVLVLWAACLCLLQVVGTTMGQGIPQQGRYLFPALAPIACCLVLGWAELWPERARGILPVAVGGGLLLLTAVSWCGYVLPAFYGG